MELKEVIPHRKSVRKYTGVPVDEQTLLKIRHFLDAMKPLYPQIPVQAQIVQKEQVRFLQPWKTPQLVAVYSRKEEGYLENVGFLFQQLDLYLQSIGLGCCWLGLGKLRRDPDREDLDFVILLAFGYPQGEIRRSSIEEFNRKSLSQISDREDPKLEPARLAPSSTNSQPWSFTHDGDVIHAYCSKSGLLRHKMLGYMNRIDMGIALAHLYLSNPQSFRFFRAEEPAKLANHSYIGSITL